MMGQPQIDAKPDEAPIGRVQRHPPALPAAALGLGQRVLKIQRGIHQTLGDGKAIRLREDFAFR